MPNLTPEEEQKLADLTDDDWQALTARVRPPLSGGDAGRAEAQRLFGNRTETK
jgi:hypothetical protein